MSEETSASKMGSVFGTTILDESGQPFIVVDYHKLIWNLVNNDIKPKQNLVITPFKEGAVGPDQYHFKFRFMPGVFTDVPKLGGWDAAVERDPQGAIEYLYVAFSGPNTIDLSPNGGNHRTEMTYSSAVEKGTSLIKIMLTTGNNVTLGDQAIPDTGFGPYHLNLVQPNVPTLSAPPISVDFVGGRTLLNDGKTDNSVTFAITNRTLADLPLTPESTGDATTAQTRFIVWFERRAGHNI